MKYYNKRKIKDNSRFYQEHKNTFDYLRSYEGVLADLDYFNKRIEENRHKRYNLKSSLPKEINVQGGVNDRMEELLDSLTEIYECLLETQSEAEKLKWEIETKIDKIKFPLNSILKKYFIEFKPFEQIAIDLKYSYERINHWGRFDKENNKYYQCGLFQEAIITFDKEFQNITSNYL